MPRASNKRTGNYTNTSSSKQNRVIWKKGPQRHLVGVSPYHCPECKMTAHQRILLSNAKHVVEEDKRSGKKRTFYYPHEKIYVGLKPGQTPPPPSTAYIATPPLSPQSQPKPLDKEEAPSSKSVADVVDQIKQTLEALRQKDALGPSAQPPKKPSSRLEPSLKTKASSSPNFVSYSESSGFWTAAQAKVEEPSVEINGRAGASVSSPQPAADDANNSKGVQNGQDDAPPPSSSTSFDKQADVSMDYIEAIDERPPIVIEQQPYQAPPPRPAMPVPPFPPVILIPTRDPPLAPSTQQPPLQSTYASFPPQGQPQYIMPPYHAAIDPVQDTWNIWARLAADVQSRVQPQTHAQNITFPPQESTPQSQAQAQEVPEAFSSTSTTLPPSTFTHAEARSMGMTELQESSVEQPDDFELEVESEKRFRDAVERYIRKECERLDKELAKVRLQKLFENGRPIRPLPTRFGRPVANLKAGLGSKSGRVLEWEKDGKMRLEWERELEQRRAQKQKKRRREDEEDLRYEPKCSVSSSSTFNPRVNLDSRPPERMPTSNDLRDSPTKEDELRPAKRVRFRDPLESIHYISTCSTTSCERETHRFQSPAGDGSRKYPSQEQAVAATEKAKVKMRVRMDVRARAQAQARLEAGKVSRVCLQFSAALVGLFSAWTSIPLMWSQKSVSRA